MLLKDLFGDVDRLLHHAFELHFSIVVEWSQPWNKVTDESIASNLVELIVGFLGVL